MGEVVIDDEVYDDPRTYDHRNPDIWMAGLRKMDAHNIKHLLITFAYFGIPESMLDVGCGTGIMVQTAKKLGVRSYGLDQLVQPDWGEGFFNQNLMEFWKVQDPVDIVFCIEVAEHIPETAHPTLCRTMCENLKEGPDHHLIFSAARPGQAGAGHIACRPAYQWHRLMNENHMSWDKEATMNLALLYSNCRSPLDYWADNLMVFSR